MRIGMQTPLLPSVNSYAPSRKSHAPYRGSNGGWWVHSY
jgi:hypothetical protein